MFYSPIDIEKNSKKIGTNIEHNDVDFVRLLSKIDQKSVYLVEKEPSLNANISKMKQLSSIFCFEKLKRRIEAKLIID